MTNSTISDNSANSSGGGINNEGTLTITNSIVANSLNGGDCWGSINDGGHNISSDDTCGFDPANGSLPNTDPMLGSLQDNGGPTWTHVLLPDSPAIDAGDNAVCPLIDQRGVPRPLDGDGDGEAVCDIGSYEFYLGQLVVTTLDDIVDPDDGYCSLREAIGAANTNGYVAVCGVGIVLTDTITFDVAGISMVASQLSVMAGGPLVIDGGGHHGQRGTACGYCTWGRVLN
jgi:CSLREA domain-containing protein